MIASVTALLPEAIRRFAGRLKFPQLFLLASFLFVADLLVPDFIPLIDEIILGLLALLFGMWQEKTRGEAGASGEMRDVTPDDPPVNPS